MARLWWHFIRFIARVCVWAYYRSFDVEGADRIPKDGPVLFVVNHPNALVDAGVVLCAVPRPVSFAAKSGLFRVPVIGWMLRRLGAVPVYRRRDKTGDARKNLDMFRAFTEHFLKDGAAAIFPEGESHTDPELKDVKSGPARVALGAEHATGFELGLRIVPLGLHYEPRHRFRGEVHVRVGEPFDIDDLEGVDRRQAIRAVQTRIADSLRPLVVHLDDVELEPLIQGVAEVYVEHQRASPDELTPRSRADVVRVAAACLNHFRITDPEAVEITRKKLRRYRRLAERAEVSAAALEADARPVRTFFGLLGLLIVMVLGLPFYLIGCLTGYVPYRLTDLAARRLARREGESALPFLRIACGALMFGVYWGALTLCVGLWSESAGNTLTFVLLLVVTSYAGRAYASRFEGWRARVVGMLPFLDRGIKRVAAARDDLLQFVNTLVVRYGTETGESLLPPRKPKWHKCVPWRTAAALLLVGLVIWFAWGLGDAELPELPDRPSPWASLNADAAREKLEHDALTLVGLLDTLEGLEQDMLLLKAGFEGGERRFTNVEDDRAVRRTLFSYLTCRSRLFRLTWMYRAPDRPGEPESSEQAFLLGYAAAIELCRRGLQLVRAFEDSADAVRKLNEGDPIWDLPDGVFDRIRKNLANGKLHAELATATGRWRQLANRTPRPTHPVWSRIWDQAEQGQVIVGALTDDLWQFKWDAAVARAERTFGTGRYSASKFFAGLISGVHIREGDLAGGLISDAQVAWLRDTQLEPGDILLERRNWALTNVFLPGFWTHAAIYTGGLEGLAALGIDADPRVTPHLDSVGRPHGGHPRLIIEALGPGVVLTSLETSVGEADAVVVLRPQLDDAELAEAVARAMSHSGKPYDFDFDFFSTDKLVCTELVYQAYAGVLDFELQDIMGRDTLPALGILEKWDRERDTGRPDLAFVCFLDSDEEHGVAREADEARLTETLDRPGMTMLQEHAGSAEKPRIFVLVLIGLLLVGLVVLRKRRG